MNQPEEARLPPGAEQPVFAEPWQASAFAIAVALHEKGLFTWGEWAEALAAEVKSGEPYYTCWLRALEGLAARKGAASRQEMEETAASWMRAAHATPHGQPILLEHDPMRRGSGPTSP